MIKLVNLFNYFFCIKLNFIRSGTFSVLPNVDATYSYMRLRVNNALIGSPPLDFVLVSPNLTQVIAVGLPMKEMTDFAYFALEPDQFIVVQVNNQSLTKTSIKPTPSTEYEFIAVGIPGHINCTLIQTQPIAPQIPTHSHIRFMHASYDLVPVDIYLNNHIIHRNLSYLDMIDYFSVDSGTYQFSAYLSNGKTLVLNSTFEVFAGQVNSFFIEGDPNGEKPELQLSLVSILDAQFEYLQFRLLYSVLDGPTINISLNIEGFSRYFIINDTNYGELSAYLLIGLDQNRNIR